MITKDLVLRKKRKIERLALIKERYYLLVLRQRQEIEKELQDDFKGDEELELELVPQVAAE